MRFVIQIFIYTQINVVMKVSTLLNVIITQKLQEILKIVRNFLFLKMDLFIVSNVKIIIMKLMMVVVKIINYLMDLNVFL